MRKPPFDRLEAGLPSAPKAKGGFVDERDAKFSTFQVETPESYSNSIFAKISQVRSVWKNKSGYRADAKWV